MPDYEHAVSVPGRHLNPCSTFPLPSSQTAVPVESLSARQPLEYRGLADSTFYMFLGDGDSGGNINNVQFHLEDLSTSPPLLSEDPDLTGPSFCPSTYTEDATMCDPETDPGRCTCTNILQVDLGAVVEIFLVNPNSSHPVAHPIHLHGHTYRVVGSGPLPPTDSLEEGLAWVRQQNEAGLITRHLDTPVQKDSVQTSPGRWTLIRFLADNPGYWLMHCHIRSPGILSFCFYPYFYFYPYFCFYPYFYFYSYICCYPSF